MDIGKKLRTIKIPMPMKAPEIKIRPPVRTKEPLPVRKK